MLEEKGIADFPKPCFGRIPNFVGSRKTAEKIKEIPEFKKARCVFCAPDFVLKRVREIVLEEGKILAIALPHMRDFLEISERKRIALATTIKGFRIFGKPLKTRIDLLVQGSVAVDRFGNRIGKGRGYGDREWEYLLKRGLILPSTKLVTLVHHAQIVDKLHGVADDFDKRVDYIISPMEIIKTLKQT